MNTFAMTEIARRHFPALMAYAASADEWEAGGQEWNPHSQVITNLKDAFHLPQVQECIRQHAHTVVAFAIVPVFDEDSLSIELQFIGRDEAQAFDKAYRRVRLHKPKVKANGPTTKLFKHRMYILPDGREFLLFGRWDQSRRIGKVVVGRSLDGTPRLANEIVDEDVLRKCRLVPKGEEPWTLKL
jgi:hypothetical protein